MNPNSSVEPTNSAELNLQASELSAPSAIGIGKTADLTLRVSAACLTLMLLQNGAEELALFERVMKIDNSGIITTQLQPIGGAAGILSCHGLEARCGSFNFDSVAAAQESDLRIYISPSQWSSMREFIESEFIGLNMGVIENTPLREIQEEIGELLGVCIESSSFEARRIGCYFQDRPRGSVRQDDAETVRVFAVDEVLLCDSELITHILHYCSIHDFDSQRAELHQAGLKKSSSLCAVPLKDVMAAIAPCSEDDRERPIPFGDQMLANNVYATVLHRI